MLKAQNRQMSDLVYLTVEKRIHVERIKGILYNV
jgi:hypothetical protein